MVIVKVGPDRFVNVERMTHVAPRRKGRLVVHFGVGGGNDPGPRCRAVLAGDEAEAFRRWLEGNSEDAGA